MVHVLRCHYPHNLNRIQLVLWNNNNQQQQDQKQQQQQLLEEDNDDDDDNSQFNEVLENLIHMVAILVHCFANKPSMTSLVLDQLIPYHWSYFLNDHKPSQSHQEQMVHAILKKWDRTLYRIVGKKKITNNERDDDERNILSEIILNEWIPYWFVSCYQQRQQQHHYSHHVEECKTDGIYSSSSTLSSSLSPLSRLLRLWDVFIASPWYCPM